MASKVSGFLRFLNFIGKLADDRIIYENIKKDPDLKPYSKHFGWSAIWHSLLFLLFGGIGGVITTACFSKNYGIILNIVGIVFGIGLILVSLEMLLFALSHTIKQLKLNRRAISWIALVVFILCVVAVGAVLFLASNAILKVME